MAILNEKAFNEILEYLEKSVFNLSKQALNNSEFASNFEDFESFVSTQFDVRLENLLKSKDSSIHHLESKMKNAVIQKKSEILYRIRLEKGI